MTEPTRVRMALGRRLTVSAAAGLIVMSIALYVAYQWYVDTPVTEEARLALSDIGLVVRSIESQRRETHAPPKALRELRDVGVRRDRAGQYIDSWERPLQYWTDGSRYRVVSLGRDGKPGGWGADCDLSSDDLPPQMGTTLREVSLPWRARPPLLQFLEDPEESTPLLMAALSGVAAFLLGYGALRGPEPTTEALLRRVLVTIIGTLFIAVVYLVPLHMALASGH